MGLKLKFCYDFIYGQDDPRFFEPWELSINDITFSMLNRQKPHHFSLLYSACHFFTSLGQFLTNPLPRLFLRAFWQKLDFVKREKNSIFNKNSIENLQKLDSKPKLKPLKLKKIIRNSMLRGKLLEINNIFPEFLQENLTI